MDIEGDGLPMPETEDTIGAGDIKRKYADGRDALSKESQNYWINQAYISGRQWIKWDRTRNTISDIVRESPSRAQITVNRIWPSSRTIIAKVLNRTLAFEVQPSGSDDASVRGSHISQSILRDLHIRRNWEDLREQATWAAWLGGTSFISLDWNPKAGTTLGRSGVTGKEFGTGDIQEQALSIVEVAFEPGVKNFETARWWIRAQALPPSEVKELYNLPKTPGADSQSALNTKTYQLSTQSDKPKDLTLVLTYYERPSSENKQGTVVTVINDEVVERTAWPFPFKDRLNVVCFRETKIPGKAAGETVVSAAVPIQTSINASWSNIVEHMKLAGNARLLFPDGTDGFDELTDLPAEVISYNSASGAPSWLSPPQMPPWWIEQPKRLAAELDDVLGIHAVSRGEAPVNIESGVGLSVLVEQDNTPIGHIVKEASAGWSRLASMVLKIYEDKVTETRNINLRQGGQTETVQWRGKDLSGQTTALVPEEAIQPRSRAAAYAMAREMWQYKVITNPIDFVRLADLPGQDALIEGMSVPTAKAKRENSKMALGEICVPVDYDNHALHIAEHNIFRQTERFESLNEQQQEVFNMHIQAHETMAAEEAGKMEARMEVSPMLATAPTAQEIPIPGAPPELPAGLPAGPPPEGAPPIQ